MELKALLVRLPEGEVTFEVSADPAAEVYSIAFLSPNAQLRSDVLYFGDSELLPQEVGEDSFLNVVVFGGGSLPEGLGAHGNVNVLRLADDTGLFESYNRLQAYFLEDQRLTAIVRAMLQAHFSNNGLQYLIEEASKALGNPIVVVDSGYHYVAYHLGELLDDTSPFASIMREELSYESILETGIDYIRREHIDGEIARLKAPLVHYNSHLGCNTMTGAVLVHGICMAHVMMMDANHPFSDLDEECFARLIDFAGQELQKTPLYEANRGQMDSYFLASLLCDEQPSAAVIERRLKVLNYKPKSALRIVCVRGLQREAISELGLDNIASQLRSILAHDIYCKHEGHLVILMNRDDGEPLGEYAESVLADVAQLNDAVVGISAPFSSLVETRRFYEQSKAAITYGELVRKVLDRGCVHHYTDYSYVQLIDVASSSKNVMDFCDPALLKLMSYDEEHGSEMMETLFCYLQSGRSTGEAARMLTLHKNTLLYRIGRIKDICGCRLVSGEEVFCLQLSFRVLMYLGLFMPHARVATTPSEA